MLKNHVGVVCCGCGGQYDASELRAEEMNSSTIGLPLTCHKMKLCKHQELSKYTTGSRKVEVRGLASM